MVIRPVLDLFIGQCYRPKDDSIGHINRTPPSIWRIVRGRPREPEQFVIGGPTYLRSETYERFVLEQCARERRRIVSDWRLQLLMRRCASERGAPTPSARQTNTLFRAMIESGSITPIPEIRGVFRIDAPYSHVLPVSDEHVVQEADPWCDLSHLTALAHHQLTDRIPSAIHATHFVARPRNRIPLGTQPEDWAEVALPRGARVAVAVQTPVIWTTCGGDEDFGHEVAMRGGAATYMTDLERTLLDALRRPQRCGGMMVVLRAWGLARPLMRVDRLVDYTDQVGAAILRQRVGFLLESLGLRHARFEAWRQKLQRGGSVRLFAEEPYSPIFSERWNLSLNAPGSLLDGLRGDSADHA